MTNLFSFFWKRKSSCLTSRLYAICRNILVMCVVAISILIILLASTQRKNFLHSFLHFQCIFSRLSASIMPPAAYASRLVFQISYSIRFMPIGTRNPRTITPYSVRSLSFARHIAGCQSLTCIRPVEGD